MFNNVVLDVFIGLIFVFLLYSLLATIVQELIARWLNLRARMLQKALRRMLEDDEGEITKGGLDNLRSETYNLFYRFFNPIRKGSMLDKFYSHPTIKYLGEDKLFSKPSYLHAHNFSQTILHLLRGVDYDGRTKNEADLVWKELNENNLKINNETLKNLKNLFADVRQDTYLFKNKLEDWFEETMERASGWYKKQTQTVLLLIGFGLAAAFNVDAIAISRILMKDKKVREQIVQLAISRQEQYGAMADSVKKITVTKVERKSGDSTITIIDSTVKSALSDKYLDSAYRTLRDDALAVQGILGLRGIGRKSDTTACTLAISNYDLLIKNAKDDTERNNWERARKKALADCLSETKSRSPYQKSAFLMVIGWLLTALAISLGAPFWFDLLNKFVKLRENGTKPANTSLLDRPAGSVPVSNPVKDNSRKEIRG